MGKRSLAAAAAACIVAGSIAVWSARPPARLRLTDRLSHEIVSAAYERYAAHEESYFDVADYLERFPARDYALKRIPGYMNFYLDDREDVIKSILAAGDPWEPKLAWHISRHVSRDTNVMDVGAHVGTHTILMDRLLDGTGTVYAFEPQAKLFTELCVNLYANEARSVAAFRYAVGDRHGAIEMDEASEGNEGGTSVGSGGDRAELVTIDELGVTNVSLMKIDVEGFEDHVLEGARRTIADSRPFIVVEIQGGVPYERADDATRAKVDATKRLIEAMDYDVERLSADDYLAVPRAGTR